MIQTAALSRLASRLSRVSIKRCSDWAEHYRVMGNPFPGKWSFKHHPWLREIQDADDDIIVIQKGAQLGVTEAALNITFYNLDILAHSVLYLLPAKTPDASDFSASRFDPALELSPHLQKLFSDTQNIGHKRAGSASLFVRGARSRSQLKSVPVDIIVFDEQDEMPQQNVTLALERMSGREKKQRLHISTPTIDNYGVNELFRDSTQEYFYFPCPSCKRKIRLTFPESIVITAKNANDPNVHNSYLICTECKATLPHEGKIDFLNQGCFLATNTDRNIRGFHVSQLYSTTISPGELAYAYLASMNDPADEQEFYNSKLGLTHVVEGARVTDDDIAACLGGYTSKQSSTAYCTMGIDVGKWLYYEVCEWVLDKIVSTDHNANVRCRVIAAGKVQTFDELEVLLHAFKPRHTVIDAHPEQRKALEIAHRFPGLVSRCYYTNNMMGKSVAHDPFEHSVKVDRTSWLDLSLLSRFKSRTIKLPRDISLEYRAHVKALVRIYRKTETEVVGRFEHGNDEDHFAHARNYCEIAFKLSQVGSTEMS